MDFLKKSLNNALAQELLNILIEFQIDPFEKWQLLWVGAKKPKKFMLHVLYGNYI